MPFRATVFKSGVSVLISGTTKCHQPAFTDVSAVKARYIRLGLRTSVPHLLLILLDAVLAPAHLFIRLC